MSITVRGIYFAASFYRRLWSGCFKLLDIYRSRNSCVWQTPAGQDKMHFCGIVQYVYRNQSTLNRKKERPNTHTNTHTYTYIYSFPLSRFHWNSVAPRPNSDKSSMKTCCLKSLEKLVLLKPCRSKTNLWEFIGDCRSWLYRFYNGDKSIMLFHINQHMRAPVKQKRSKCFMAL